MKFFKVFLISFLFTNSGIANAKEYSSKTLFKYYKDAVVKIDHYYHGVKLGYGTGFFIDNEGTLATNLHVAKEGVLDPGNTLKFTTHDKKVITEFKIGDCGDKRGIDLCILKLKHTPKRWIPLETEKVDIGEKVYVIGHPRGFDFSISSGIVSGYRNLENRTLAINPNSKKAIEQVQVSAPISPGNSGGPIISSRGKLVGVVEWIRVDKGSQNLNFAISSPEVVKYKNSIKKYVTKAELMKTRRAKAKQLIAKVRKNVVDPVWDVLEHNEKKKKWEKKFNKNDVAVIDFEGFQNNYRLPLMFGNLKACSRVKNTKRQKKYHCIVNKNKYGYVVTIENPGPKADLMRFNKHMIKPIPLPHIAGYYKNKTWDKVKGKFTAKQQKFLHTFQSKPTKCKTHKKSYYYGKGNVTCIESYYNYRQTNQVAVTHSRQFYRGGDIIIISGYSYDADYSYPIYAGAGIANLAMLPIKRKLAPKPRINRMPASVQSNSRQGKAARPDLDGLRYKCKIKGSIPACKSLAVNLQKYKSSLTDERDFYEAVSKVCTGASDGAACFFAAKGATHFEPSKKKSWLKKSCELNYSKACNQLRGPAGL